MAALHTEGERDVLRGREERVGPPLLGEHNRRLRREESREGLQRERLSGKDLVERVLVRIALAREGERDGEARVRASRERHLEIKILSDAREPLLSSRRRRGEAGEVEREGTFLSAPSTMKTCEGRRPGSSYSWPKTVWRMVDKAPPPLSLCPGRRKYSLLRVPLTKVACVTWYWAR